MNPLCSSGDLFKEQLHQPVYFVMEDEYMKTRKLLRILTAVSIASIMGITMMPADARTPHDTTLDKKGPSTKSRSKMKRRLIRRPGGKLPNLVVKKAKMTLARTCKPYRPVLYATAWVKNIGNATSPAKLSVGIVGAKDTDGSGWGNGKGTPAIAPGQMVKVTFPIYYLIANPGHMPGTHAFKFRLNSGKWITESNYSDNFFGPVSITVPRGHCKVPGKLADITSKKGITIGGKHAPWGGIIKLKASDANIISGGKCSFLTSYDMLNQGTAATSPLFKNRLRRNSVVNAINSGLSLNAGEVKNITTHPYYVSGWQSVQLSLDDNNVVTESLETNNKFSIRLHIKGRCAGNAQRKPDLVAVLTNPMTGKIMVKNIGAGNADPSKLTLSCDRLGYTGPGPECPESPGLAAYDDAAFPDKVVVSVPALAAGTSYSHTLSFWRSLRWKKGKYVFKAFADAGLAVSESNEGNNTATSTLSK